MAGSQSLNSLASTAHRVPCPDAWCSPDTERPAAKALLRQVDQIVDSIDPRKVVDKPDEGDAFSPRGAFDGGAAGGVARQTLLLPVRHDSIHTCFPAAINRFYSDSRPRRLERRLRC